MSDAGITVVWILGIGLMTWFLFIRPRRRMMTRQRDLLGALSSGDQVVTVGGMYGTIVALDGDEVRLEIAPDVVDPRGAARRRGRASAAAGGRPRSRARRVEARGAPSPPSRGAGDRRDLRDRPTSMSGA